MKTVGGVSLKASEYTLISYNSMKTLCIVTFKEYENLVYCNLVAILHIFFLSNNIQITAWLDENYRRWAKNEILLEQSLKSYNSFENLVYCNLKRIWNFGVLESGCNSPHLLSIQQHTNNSLIRWSEEWTGNKILLEQSLKSCNSTCCTVTPHSLSYKTVGGVTQKWKSSLKHH